MSAAGKTLRVVSFIEGITYICLMGIAMPLKYAAGMPLAVRIAGSAHGLLFVLFVAALAWAWWSDERAEPTLLVEVFVASLIPFGMLWADRRIDQRLGGPGGAANGEQA